MVYWLILAEAKSMGYSIATPVLIQTNKVLSCMSTKGSDSDNFLLLHAKFNIMIRVANVIGMTVMGSTSFMLWKIVKIFCSLLMF